MAVAYGTARDVAIVPARWAANRSATIESTVHPVAKVARISACVTRRGPSSPGWCSLKQSGT
jgi:hypothetical protein